MADVPALVDGERYHVFISHCSADVDFSLELKAKLEQDGFKCFHSDEDFKPGETIVKNIMDGIDKSRRVITIISPEMMSSKWVEFEVANSRAKANEKKEVTFIPILYNIKADKVPAYVKEINYIEHTDPNFWPKLKRSISESIPLTATIPAGHIAHGLAWSFFYGYLAFVLPKLSERAQKSEEFGRRPNFLPKMVIVLPETCNCPGDVSKVDENVTHVGKVEFKATRAGKVDRDYKSSVFKVVDPETQEEFYTIMEYATPLLSMYEMEQGRIANLDHLEKIRQMKLFKDKLEEILNHPNNKDCHDKAVLVTLKDHGADDSRERLATVLSTRIKQVLKRMKVSEEPMDQ